MSAPLLPGYHLIDGDMRQLAVEGTVDVMEAIVGVGRRSVGKDGNHILLNTAGLYKLKSVDPQCGSACYNALHVTMHVTMLVTMHVKPFVTRVTRSLKPPGFFKPCAYDEKRWFQSLLSNVSTCAATTRR